MTIAKRTRIAWIMLAVIVSLTLFTTCSSVIAFAEDTDTSNKRIIVFEYLKRIEGTPFAEKIHTMIKVPVYEDHQIRLADVKKELNCSSFGVMQSYGDDFVYDATTNVYKAVYYKSVYLNAKTVDGNSKNFYLDCNLSFKDYFYPFVQDGTLEQEIYEFYLNKIHLLYPELDGYAPENIYGYFGLIPIPSGRDLNQLWKDLFGTPTSYDGVLEHYMYSNVLSHAAYKKLLDDYHYSWLEVIWKSLVNALLSGTVNADFYMVYVDSEETEAFIAENNASDINDDRGTIGISIDNTFSDLGNGIVSWFDERQDTTKKILAIVGGVLLISVAIGLILRLSKTKPKDKE